jgi:hypothetical protein
MEKERVMVYTTNKGFEAEILKQVLADEGITAFSINKMDSNYLFGEIEIYVLPDDVIKAKLVIEKFEN